MYSSTVASVANTLTELPVLIDNLLLLLSDKEKEVIKRRFALSGTNRATLEEIGRDFSVTRERVRQVEKNALVKMKRNVFNTALKDLHEYVGSSVRKNGGLIKTNSLLNEVLALLPPTFKVEPNNLTFSFVLHENLDSIGNTINFYPYVKELNLSDYSLKHASNHLVNHLYKNGDVLNLNILHKDLRSVMDDLSFDLIKMRSLIEIDKRMTILSGDFVGLLEWRHIHPRTLRDKILFILRSERKPMHFLDISDRITNASFDNRQINVQAVHNELIRHEQFVLIGRGIYALSEWGYERGTVADVIEKILEEKTELSQDDIVDLVLKRREVKKITIVLALKNNNKFERIGRRRYRLLKKA